MLLLNAFSLNMRPGKSGNLWFREIGVAQVRAELAPTLESAVGHAETAAVFSDVLGVPVAFDRRSVSLQPGQTVLVGQYSGPRLPEGATTLPEGATTKWLLVGYSEE